NFTTINGGLVLTSLIKMIRKIAGVDVETGGLSANFDNILLYGGGTYAQAMQNLAKIILRHDGSGQLAGGNLTWDTAGNVNIIDGKLSIANEKILLNKDGSGKLANGNISWDVNGNIDVIGKFESSASGNRIVIDPTTNSIKMINSNGKTVCEMSFYSSAEGISVARVRLRGYNTAEEILSETTLEGGLIATYTLNNNIGYDMNIGAKNGITFYQNGVLKKTYPAS
ncbi:hypothetical protein EZS27_033063, partial [termite gut metagenome]